MVILEIPDYNGWKYGCSGLFRKTFWSCWVLVDCSASTCLWQHGFPRWYELILPLWVSPSPWPVSTNGTVAILMSQQGESFDSQVCIFYHSQKICQSLTGRGKEKAGAGFGEKSKFLFVWSVVVVVQRSSRSQEMRRNSSLKCPTDAEDWQKPNTTRSGRTHQCWVKVSSWEKVCFTLAGHEQSLFTLYKPTRDSANSCACTKFTENICLHYVRFQHQTVWVFSK